MGVRGETEARTPCPGKTPEPTVLVPVVLRNEGTTSHNVSLRIARLDTDGTPISLVTQKALEIADFPVTIYRAGGEVFSQAGDYRVTLDFQGDITVVEDVSVPSPVDEWRREHVLEFTIEPADSDNSSFSVDFRTRRSTCP